MLPNIKTAKMSADQNMNIGLYLTKADAPKSSISAFIFSHC